MLALVLTGTKVASAILGFTVTRRLAVLRRTHWVRRTH